MNRQELLFVVSNEHLQSNINNSSRCMIDGGVALIDVDDLVATTHACGGFHVSYLMAVYLHVPT